MPPIDGNDDDFEFEDEQTHHFDEEAGRVITEDRFAQIPRRQLEQLRAKAKMADGLAKHVAAQERTIAFIRAGVPRSRGVSYFYKAYDGPLEPAAIRKAAREAGLYGADDDEPIPGYFDNG